LGLACVPVLVVGLVWLAGPGMVQAQAGGLWTFYSAESAEGGPPSSTIHGLLAVQDGLWVTTADGIGHFDGHRWQSYGSQSGASARPSSGSAGGRSDWPFEWPGVMPAMALVNEGDVPGLWVGTPYGIAVRHSDGSWAPFPHNDKLPRSTVTALLASRDGTVWIGTQSGLARWDGHRLTTIDPPGPASSYFLSMAEDASGGLWSGTVNNGLYYFDETDWSCFTGHDNTTELTSACERLLPGVSADVHALAADGGGGLWVGTGSGLAHLVGGASQPLSQELAVATYGQ